MPETAVERLLGIASASLSSVPLSTSSLPSAQLTALLNERNGFYAFESALHVFPFTPSPTERSVAQWNEPNLWREVFDGVAESWCFFAEDAFGGQFALGVDGSVSVFDPETAGFKPLAVDIEGWAQALVNNHRMLTGWPIAHDWQVLNGELRPGRRLIPKVPFVLGGEFSLDNLYDADAVSAMRYRADLAAQLRDLPDGTKVRLRVID